MIIPKRFFTALPGIKKQMLKCKTDEEKKEYLYWIKKEMNNMVAEFRRIDADWMFKIAKEGFSSRDKHLDSFIKTGVKALTHSNELTKNNLYDYVKNQVKVREEIVIHQIDNEIEYLERGDGKKELSNKENKINGTINKINSNNTDDKDKYKEMWEDLINSHFKTDILIWQLEKIGEDNDDEYIAYCIKKFKRRTIAEWMKYYERADKAEQYESLKNANLEPELEYKNTMRITNAKFEESTLGQYTLGNLQLFESKYVLQNYATALPNIIGIYRSVVKQYIYQRKPVRELISSIETGINELELKFESDVDEFPEDLKTEIEIQKAKLNEAQDNLGKIDLKLWGDFSRTNEGLIWKHDRLVREYKRIMVGDDSLFSELENKETERWNKMMKQKIRNIAGNTDKELKEEELDDIILEVLEIRLSDNEIVLEEIVNPDQREANLLEAINVVLQKKYYKKNEKIDKLNGEVYVLNKDTFNRHVELFDFDFIKIIDYADKLDYQKAIEYLERVLEEARKFTGFDNNLDKGLFETDLQKTICEKQFKLDITEPFNYRQFKTYDFNQQLILSYAKYIQEVKDRIKYFNFILREYDYAIKAINCHLNPESGLDLVHSDYYQIIHREAYLYARYKEDKGEGEFEKIMDLYLIDMKNRLDRVAKRISEELNFSLDLLGENKNEPDKKISDEAHTSTDLTNINNELSSAQTIILKQRNTIRTLKKGITQSDLIDIIEKNKCRFKNTKINYTKLAKILGCSNHTAKNKCEYYGIK